MAPHYVATAASSFAVVMALLLSSDVFSSSTTGDGNSAVMLVGAISLPSVSVRDYFSPSSASKCKQCDDDDGCGFRGYDDEPSDFDADDDRNQRPDKYDKDDDKEWREKEKKRKCKNGGTWRVPVCWSDNCGSQKECKRRKAGCSCSQGWGGEFCTTKTAVVIPAAPTTTTTTTTTTTRVPTTTSGVVLTMTSTMTTGGLVASTTSLPTATQSTTTAGAGGSTAVATTGTPFGSTTSSTASVAGTTTTTTSAPTTTTTTTTTVNPPPTTTTTTAAPTTTTASVSTTTTGTGAAPVPTTTGTSSPLGSSTGGLAQSTTVAPPAGPSTTAIGGGLGSTTAAATTGVSTTTAGSTTVVTTTSTPLPTPPLPTETAAPIPLAPAEDPPACESSALCDPGNKLLVIPGKGFKGDEGAGKNVSIITPGSVTYTVRNEEYVVSYIAGSQEQYFSTLPLRFGFNAAYIAQFIRRLFSWLSDFWNKRFYVQAEYTRYVAEVAINNNSAQVDPLFNQTLYSLPKTFAANKAGYRDLISRYGTHLVTSVVYGARLMSSNTSTYCLNVERQMEARAAAMRRYAFTGVAPPGKFINNIVGGPSPSFLAENGPIAWRKNITFENSLPLLVQMLPIYHSSLIADTQYQRALQDAVEDLQPLFEIPSLPTILCGGAAGASMITMLAMVMTVVAGLLL